MRKITFDTAEMDKKRNRMLKITFVASFLGAIYVMLWMMMDPRYSALDPLIQVGFIILMIFLFGISIQAVVNWWN
jgi:hypothetical protein